MNNIYIKIFYYNIINDNNIPNKNYFLNLINNFLNNKNNNFNISIVITNKKIIKYLNFKYKNKNNYTNILTFISKNFYINNKFYIFIDFIICKKVLEYESHIYNKNIYNYWFEIIKHGCLYILKENDYLYTKNNKNNFYSNLN